MCALCYVSEAGEQGVGDLGLCDRGPSFLGRGVELG